MGREKNYIGINVYEAAYKRCKQLLTSFDDVVVNFSGGKDSLVTLELLDKVRKDLRIEKKYTSCSMMKSYTQIVMWIS